MWLLAQAVCSFPSLHVRAGHSMHSTVPNCADHGSSSTTITPVESSVLDVQSYILYLFWILAFKSSTVLNKVS